MLKSAASLLLILCMGGCASLPEVKPWERGNLAKPSMLLDGDPMEVKFDRHIYSSKENASGGYGVGGGGCGCN